jgi:ATP-dependent DNA helicase RecQ
MTGEISTNPTQLLHSIFGFDSFRQGQKEIIDHLVRKSHVLAVMPTGSGKSLCYQVPPLVLNQRAVIVSPLMALMDDQVAALQDIGVPADRIHSNRTYEDNSEAWNRFKARQPSLLYMSPEMLMSQRMLTALQRVETGMFVIDEAHCISKWGANFRPDYEALSKLNELFPDAVIAAFTATADAATQQDIIQKLTNNNCIKFVQGFDRPNLRLTVKAKLNWKTQLLDFLEGKKQCSGIVYCLSRKQTEDAAEFLRTNGYNSVAYHAGLDSVTRSKNQDRFMTEPYVIMTATIAFGMGIDKPDIRFVAHVSLPGSMEAYYQEIGRAGRDGKTAETLLMYGLSDLFQRRRFIEEDGEDESHKLREHKRLDSLLAYCEAPSCRRIALLHYFDEQIAPCGNCDNCLSPPKLVDGTELAQMTLSAIYRTGQSFGTAHIIDVLRGSQSEKILERNHNQIKTFGVGSEYSKPYLQSFIRQLIAAGHVVLNIKKFGGLEISKSGFILLKGKIRFQYKQPSESTKKQKTGRTLKESIPEHIYSGEDAELVSRLKQERLSLAQDQGVPAFVVFPDTVLYQMVERKPTNRDEFATLVGVGPAKLKKYGDSFLAVINSS